MLLSIILFLFCVIYSLDMERSIHHSLAIHKHLLQVAILHSLAIHSNHLLQVDILHSLAIHSSLVDILHKQVTPSNLQHLVATLDNLSLDILANHLLVITSQVHLELVLLVIQVEQEHQPLGATREVMDSLSQVVSHLVYLRYVTGIYALYIFNKLHFLCLSF